MRGCFVTGTGTEVGKTIVAAAIARSLSATGTVAVFKPAESGLDELDGGTPDHELLRLASGSPQPDDEIAPHRFGPAVSPHLAAELAGTEIDFDAVIAAARRAGDGAEFLVCEGVGGFLVPLTASRLVRDLAVALALPCVIAAAPGLGTINHTLLTIESVRAAGLEVAAVVLTPWPSDPGDLERSNRASITALGEAEVLTLPRIDTRDPSGWPAISIPGLP